MIAAPPLPLIISVTNESIILFLYRKICVLEYQCILTKSLTPTKKVYFELYLGQQFLDSQICILIYLLVDPIKGTAKSQHIRYRRKNAYLLISHSYL